MVGWIGELAAVGTAVLWTFSALAWTSAGRHVGALSVSFLRLVLTFPFLMVYGGAVRRLWFPSDASADAWMLLGLSGLVGFFLADLCLFKALLLIGPRLTLLFQTIAPPMAALMAWAAGGPSLGGRGWLAMAITVAGVAWVVLEQPESRHRHARRGAFTWGVVLALVSAVGVALGYVLSKRGIGQYDAVAATFIRALGAMIGYVGLITVANRWPAVWRAARHPRAMWTMTWGALVGPFLGVALSMVALRHCHPGVAATIFSTTPVLILPLLVLFYRERVSWRALGGAVLSVAGVALLLM